MQILFNQLINSIPNAPLRYQSSLMQQRNTRSFFFKTSLPMNMDAVVPNPHVGWQRLVVKLSHATWCDPSEVDYSGQVCGYSPGVEDEGSKRVEGSKRAEGC